MEEIKETLHAAENLCAVIHGDGGHYREKHGIIKALQDAQEKYYKVLKVSSLFEEEAARANASLNEANAKNAKLMQENEALNNKLKLLLR